MSERSVNFPFLILNSLSALFALLTYPFGAAHHLLLGEAAERNYDHSSLTSPVVGEEKSFSPKLGEMVRSTREVCCFIVDHKQQTSNHSVVACQNVAIRTS